MTRVAQRAGERGATLVEICIYVLILVVVTAVLWGLLSAGSRLFHKTEGHQEALQAASLVDRIIERDMACLVIRGRKTPGVTPVDKQSFDISPFTLDEFKLSPLDVNVPPVIAPETRDLAAGDSLVITMAERSSRAGVFRPCQVTYSLERRSVNDRAFFQLRRIEKPEGGSSRDEIIQGARLANVVFQLLSVTDDRSPPERRRPPLFFIRWTVVGLSSSLEDVRAKEFFSSMVVNGICVPRLAGMFRPDAPGVFWNVVRGDGANLNYWEN